MHDFDTEIHKNLTNKTFRNQPEQNVLPVIAQKAVNSPPLFGERVHKAEPVEREERQEVEHAKGKAHRKEQISKIGEEIIEENGHAAAVIEHDAEERIKQKGAQIVDDDARNRRERKPQAVTLKVPRIDFDGFCPTEADERKAYEPDPIEVAHRV